MEQNIFSGKSALIVGGTGGIGREVSLALSKTGADITVLGSHAGEKCDSITKDIAFISKKNPRIIVQNLLETPFSELDSSPLLAEVRKCDVLCVCFGPFVQKPLHETGISDWKTVSLFDYALPGLLVSTALPHMMENRFGRILLFGGTGTFHRTEFSTNAAYAGAKAGLNVLTASVAANYARYGITCNAILPGFTETEYLPESAKAGLRKKMPLGDMISAHSIAEKALFLLENPDMNGVLLRVDGGWSPLQGVQP